MHMDIDDPCRSFRVPWRAVVIQPAVLYVENNFLLAQLVTDLLDLAGWHVWRAENGTIAQTFLRHEQRFALLLVDNELRDTSGIELVKYARTLPHRKSLPVILFSIEDCAREAKEAGADEFLRKPHDLFRLMEIARRFVTEAERKRYK
ncbi:MAG TPA: response regulator [Pyrinomonadaceae bacterium]|jgi:CheY-like chemotaxis protein